jgi:hypothetical protein
MQPQEISVLEWVWRILTTLVIPVAIIGVTQIFKTRLKLALLEHRTTTLEGTVKELSGNELSIAIEKLNGEIKSLHQGVTSLTETVGRHEDYLMSQGGRQ